jgi:protein-tyrosine phosphatase
MLTACIESGRHKSARYWPEQIGGSPSFKHYTNPTDSPHRKNQRAEFVPGPLPPIRVEYLDRRPSSAEDARAGRGWRTNKLRLSTSGTDPVDINHIEYLGWQDHGVPDSPAEVLRLLDYLNTLIELDEPVVTHCSAGVGRTGSFISIAWLLPLLAAYRATGGKANRTLEATSPMGPLPPVSQRHTGVLSSLLHKTKDEAHEEDEDPVMAVIDGCRDQRTTMVQTPAQVDFVYEAARTWWKQQHQSKR